MGKLFGTDGVRGLANEQLTPELAFDLGRAATYYFGKHGEKQPVILIGRDTRISGQMLESALAAGICSAGGKALLAGVIPTPAIAFLTKQIGAQAGVVISASHNPYPDNGIKFFAGTGFKLPDAVENELEELIFDLGSLERPIANGVGTIEYRHNLIEDYIAHALTTIDVSLAGLHVVLDCANGAAFEVSPRILTLAGAKVTVLHNEPNGININDHCGSTHLQSLQEAVRMQRADVGIAHDGDADRCLAVDERGEIIDGDHMMVICANMFHQAGRLQQDTLVTTVMSNIGLHQAMKRSGIAIEITPVGDRYVLERMLEKGFNFGGEQSGHIIFSDYATTGDGMITALQLLAAKVKAKKPFSELSASMTTFPQLLVNVRVASKDGWEENKAIAAAITAGEELLGDSGRILVRPSGTEPLIRVMAEGPTMVKLEKIVTEIAAVVKVEQGQAE
ncbi:MAG: phosphoglucosamine mutase [Sporomusaceae bacterium]|nr:phosphoglucosamine mutase [Sporomusaceae bacterium]